MRTPQIRSCIAALFCLPLSIGSVSLAQAPKSEPPKDVRKVKTTTIEPQSVTVTDKSIARIHAKRRLTVRSLEKGLLKKVAVKEGQTVKEGDLLFEVTPVDEDGKEIAKSSPFFSVKAPFGGLIGPIEVEEGDPVEEGDQVTTLSALSTLWVYFTISEARYRRFMAEEKKKTEAPKFELVLVDGKKFDQPGMLGAVEAEVNAETDSITFRVDYPNPDRLLSHGQRGTMLMHQILTDAIVISQQATLEKEGKTFVYIVDKSSVVHQREIVIQNKLEKQFVIETGLATGDKIVVDGIKQLHDGDTIKSVDR